MNPIARRVLTGVVTGGLCIAAILLVPPRVVLPVSLTLAALASAEFVALQRQKIVRWGVGPILGTLLGVSVLVGAMLVLSRIAVVHGNIMLFYLLAIVKFSDTGGFAFGLTSARLLKGGNHKLCPSISPGKSWEGLLGSVVFSCVVSLAFVPWTHFALGKALAFGVAAALVGTFGDLVESKYKRWVGVKDSGTFMPAGLGGFLDMLDSVLFAPGLLLLFV